MTAAAWSRSLLLGTLLTSPFLAMMLEHSLEYGMTVPVDVKVISAMVWAASVWHFRQMENPR